MITTIYGLKNIQGTRSKSYKQKSFTSGCVLEN